MDAGADAGVRAVAAGPVDAATWDGGFWTMISASAAIVYTGLTVVLLVGVYLQFKAMRLQRTLDACNRHDVDPILDAASRAMWKATNHGTEVTAAARAEVSREIFLHANYLEGIAIGVKKKFYDSEIAKSYLADHFKWLWEQYLTPECHGDYPNLVWLANKWELAKHPAAHPNPLRRPAAAPEKAAEQVPPTN